MAKFALTTIDNPFNPFNDFSSWYLYDESKGYKSSELLARIARTSEQLSDEENDLEIERAIDTILSIDFLGIFQKVKKDDKIKAISLEKEETTNKAEKTDEKKVKGA